MHKTIEYSKKKTKKLFGVFFRIFVTTSIITYLYFKVDWLETINLLRQTDIFWLVISCVLFGIALVFAGIRWWLLLLVQNIRLPSRVIISLGFIGQFFNSFLLGTVGGDVVKLFYIFKYYPSNKTRATLSIIMDRMIGMFVLLACALVSLPWQFHYLASRDETQNMAWALIMIFILIVSIGIIVAAVPFQKFPKIILNAWKKIPRYDVFESMVTGFRQHRYAYKPTILAFFCSFLVQIIIFISSYCIAKAIHLEIDFMQLMLILVLVTCIISLPISIGGHGLREGTFIVMFTVFGVVATGEGDGVGKEIVVLFSLLYFAVSFVWSLIGGVIYLTFQQAYGEYHNETEG